LPRSGRKVDHHPSPPTSRQGPDAKRRTVVDVARNRRARFDYEILEKLECGVALLGAEVKSIRAGRASLQDGFCRVERGELWLRNANIETSLLSSAFDKHDPGRPRKLLAHAKEIRRLKEAQDRKGLTIVPLRLYVVDRTWVKVEIALGRGKKQQDKREAIQRRDEDRGLRRAVKGLQ